MKKHGIIILLILVILILVIVYFIHENKAEYIPVLEIVQGN